MTTHTATRTSRTRRGRQPAAGVGGWSAGWSGSAAAGPAARPGDGPVVPTEQAWRAGVAEGLRLAQAAIRKGV